jgi:hypothetical protein
MGKMSVHRVQLNSRTNAVSAATVLAGQTSDLLCEDDPAATNRFYPRGFWRMSPGGRNAIHACTKTLCSLQV